MDASSFPLFLHFYYVQYKYSTSSLEKIYFNTDHCFQKIKILLCLNDNICTQTYSLAESAI